MATIVKLVLFEDTAGTRSELLAALQGCLDPPEVVIPFAIEHFTEAAANKQQMYESRLERILSSRPYEGATLIVADRDLSKSQDAGFAGLSVNTVAAAAKKLAIPVCSYARQPEGDDFEWRGRWEEGHIVLRFSEGVEELARRAVLAAKGFAQILDKLPAVLAEKANSSSARILAALLGKLEYAEKIALYGVGDQSRLSELFAKERQGGRLGQRMAHFLGYWLWDSLLRYPGLLANEIAAGSHLNIETSDFLRADVQSVFAEALYGGPFADSKRPQWWRGILDDIVARENCNDGLELVRTRASASIRGSQCCVDPSVPAGYYCIVSRSPVSLRNSKGGLSWFPRGADLTRISLPKFEEYGPWLGA